MTTTSHSPPHFPYTPLFRSRSGEEIGHLGVDFARPRPAPDVGDAGGGDRDDRDLVGGSARARLHAQVVGFAFQTGNKAARAAESKNGEHHDGAEEPVGLPESRLHAAPPPLRTPSMRPQAPLKQRS